MNKSHIYKTFPQIYKLISGNDIYSFPFRKLGVNSYLHKENKILNPQRIKVGSRVTIEKDVWLNIIPNSKGVICIEDEVKIGMRVTLSAATEIILHKNILLGNNIYIADHEHEYKKIDIPIMYQNIKIGKGVEVGENSWIGNNVIILSSKRITIGKNSVIGANSVLKHSIPDYAIAAGNPAKIIKKYDMHKKEWIKIAGS